MRTKSFLASGVVRKTSGLFCFTCLSPSCSATLSRDDGDYLRAFLSGKAVNALSLADAALPSALHKGGKGSAVGE